MLGTIMLTVITLLFFGVLPIWPYSSKWGYKPTGIVAVLLVLCVIGILLGRFEI